MGPSGNFGKHESLRKMVSLQQHEDEPHASAARGGPSPGVIAALIEKNA